MTMFSAADVIGPYEIVAFLGEGGNSIVYKAKRRINDTPIALKVLSPHLAKNTKHVGAFFDEAVRVEPLQHKSIIQIYHYGSVIATTSGNDDGNNNVHYIAMAYAQEGTLKQELADEGEARKKLPWREALAVAKQIASALRYTHEHGLIHCDVKPSNILCLTKGHYVLSDFGIARRKDEVISEVIGTPEYMSPEQCNGTPLDERSDIYSLGVVLYEMLAGRPPFTATEPMVVMHKHREQPPSPVSQYTAQIPKGVVALVNRTLEKQPTDRFSDMAALIEAIEQQLNTVAGGIPKWMFIGVTAIIMLGLGLGAWQMNNRQTAGGAIIVSPTVLVWASTVVEPDPTSVVLPGVGGIATTESNILAPVLVSSPTVLATRLVQNAPNALATSTLAPTPSNTPIPPPTRVFIPTPSIALPQPATVALPTVALPTRLPTVTIVPQPTNPQPANPQPANPQPANPQPANPQPAPPPQPQPPPATPQPQPPQPAAPGLPSCAALPLNEVPRPGRNCS